jgi:hypothetical protein
MMADWVAEQLRVYSSTVEKIEQWQLDHLEAMVCGDAEHALRYGLTMLESVRRDNESWASAIERGTIQFSWEQAEIFADFYRSWSATSQTLVPIIEQLESIGFMVDGAEEFRTACREVALMSLDVDRVRDNIGALEAGRGTTLDQAMYALRNSPC